MTPLQITLSRRAVIKSLVGSSILLPGIISELLAAEAARGASTFDPLAGGRPRAVMRSRLIDLGGFVIGLGWTIGSNLVDVRLRRRNRAGVAKDVEVDREGPCRARFEFGHAAKLAFDAPVVRIAGAGLQTRHVSFFFGVRVFPKCQK